jgi:hypothetical protein
MPHEGDQVIEAAVSFSTSWPFSLARTHRWPRIETYVAAAPDGCFRTS